MRVRVHDTEDEAGDVVVPIPRRRVRPQRKPRPKRKKTRNSVALGIRQSCSYKVKHASRAEAEEAIKVVKARKVLVPGQGFRGWLHAYRCSHCNHWHTGHTRRDSRTMEKKA